MEGTEESRVGGTYKNELSTKFRNSTEFGINWVHRGAGPGMSTCPRSGQNNNNEGAGSSFRLLLLFLFSFFFLLFRVTPETHGSSQPRDSIRAAAAGLHHSHSNVDLSCVCNIHRSSEQHQMPDPLIKARDPTRILRVTSWVVTTESQQELPINTF